MQRIYRGIGHQSNLRGISLQVQGTLKNRYFRHPADSNPLIIQAPNLRKLYFSRCPSKDAILEIEKQVFLDLHSLLDKAYKIAHDIIEDVACATEGTSKEIMREARSYFPKIVNPFDRCRKKLNLWLHRTELGPLQVFILRECKQLEPLDKRDTPVKSIIAAYSALEHQAEQLRCVSRRTEFESDKLLRYSTKYAYKARFWDTLAR